MPLEIFINILFFKAITKILWNSNFDPIVFDIIPPMFKERMCWTVLQSFHPEEQRTLMTFQVIWYAPLSHSFSQVEVTIEVRIIMFEKIFTACNKRIIVTCHNVPWLEVIIQFILHKTGKFREKYFNLWNWFRPAEVKHYWPKVMVDSLSRNNH